MLSIGQIGSSACSFIRNIVVARVLSVEEFGIAATFAMTLSIVEMSSQLALDKYLIQHENGAKENYLANAHAMSILRGILLSVILFLASWPIAALFDLKDILWAFQILSISPLVRGFMHLDYAVEQREFGVKQLTLNELIPQILSTILLWPLLLVFADYRAMLFSLLGLGVFSVIVSHWQARRRFELRFERKIQLEILAFGWPLMINGLLMFGIFQGDRVLVGSGYGIEALGLYSAAFGLLMLPSLILHRIYNAYALPALSNAKADIERFICVSFVAVVVGVIAAVLMGVASLMFGEAVLVLVYGQKYSSAAPLLMWLAIMQAIRVSRIPASTIAMSQGDTRNEMYSNLMRSCAIILGLGAIGMGYPVLYIALAGVVGELCAAALSYYLSRQYFLKAQLFKCLLIVLVFGCVLCIAFLVSKFTAFSWLITPILCTALVVISGFLLIGLIPKGWSALTFRNCNNAIDVG